MNRAAETGWETATWEGSRRAQLRAALSMTVRERLQALEDLARLAERLAAMPRTQRPTAGPSSGRSSP
ncbi:MAG TPA: hypothetical protein VEM38_09640 [Burkholderiales bacterium]|nr:hypothetical protein [Burkholderiales bacterium]